LSPPSRSLGLVAIGFALLISASRAPADDGILFAARFPASGLVTNEFAYWNSGDSRAHRSADWQMDSGSLFARSGAGSTGPPDVCNPDPTSSRCTDSAIFRLTTRRSDFADVRVSFRLRILRFLTTRATPAVPWDGVHIWLRYRSERQLYYASVARRDGHIVLKKKCPGGPSNGGTYYVLAERSGFPVSLARWRTVAAEALDLSGGGVLLRLQLGGRTLLTARDHGVGCAALRGPGHVGIRGDNAEFEFRAFVVRKAP
jgi:hypothetical protein